MKIVRITGGLGNQMFSYALYYVLTKKNKLSFVFFDTSKALNQHNGFEINKIFPNSLSYTLFYQKFIKKIQSLFFAKGLFTRIVQTAIGFQPDLLKSNQIFCIYEGFWQSEEYFGSYKEEIRTLFSFDVNLLNAGTKEAWQKMKSCNAVSIHIRRGDYLTHYELKNSCTEEYYLKAIQLMCSLVDEPVYYLFSDDTDWVKKYFNQPNFVLVDWNNQEDSWQDMFLMSQCKHNIIANSTFSWWGAWLNNTENKCVIAPRQWYTSADDPDIIPPSWIRI